MANIQSAKKRIRQTATRTDRNIARRSRMRTFVKRAEAAIASGDQAAANEAVKAAQAELDKAAQKGVIKRNMAARKVSRLNARARAIAAS